MPSYKWIDTRDLPAGTDIADLVDDGITGDVLLNWIRERIQDGPPRLEKNDKRKESARKRSESHVPKSTAPDPEPLGSVVPMPRSEPDPDLGAAPLEFTEDQVASTFTEVYMDRLKKPEGWKYWAWWTEKQWLEDKRGQALHWARVVCRDKAIEVSNRTELGNKADTISKALSKGSTVRAVENLARTDPRHFIDGDAFDTHAMILNTPGGIVDLTTGKTHRHDKNLYCSKMTNVSPEPGPAPAWEKFLQDCTQSDDELIEYLQKIGGYCLTGSTSEQKFFFIYGTGTNGKGTYMNLLQWILGSYAMQADIKMFTEQKFASHSTELTDLKGMRLVKAEETTGGQKWDEARVKWLTGGDRIRARKMREDNIEFKPRCKLLFAGNNKPSLRNVDPAIKRRLYMIPFEYQVPDELIDGDLDKKLKREAPQILTWFIEGCLKWQADGHLSAPAIVRAMTDEYFENEDRIGSFLEWGCDLHPSGYCGSTALYGLFKIWCDEEGSRCCSQAEFRDLLATKGYRSQKQGGAMIIPGIDIKPERDYRD